MVWFGFLCPPCLSQGHKVRLLGGCGKARARASAQSTRNWPRSGRAGGGECRERA